MKHFIKLRYPKLLLLLAIVILSYLIFRIQYVKYYAAYIGNLGYVSYFIAGILFAFGFSAPIAIGFFVVAQPQNMIISALSGGLGAVLGDLLIFHFIRLSFMDEFNRLNKTRPFRMIKQMIKRNIKAKIRNYLLYFFAEIIIASPVADEVGVSMLAGLTSIKQKTFALITFIFHAIAIFIILIISH